MHQHYVALMASTHLKRNFDEVLDDVKMYWPALEREKPTVERLWLAIDLLKQHSIPVQGSYWYHYKNPSPSYKVLHIAKHSTEGALVVVYQNTVTKAVWVRPLSEWNEVVNAETGQRRFYQEVD